MVQVTAEEAKVRLGDLIEEALKGEIVYIQDDKNQVVQLLPVTQANQPRRAGSAKGLIVMSEDFDEPLEEFKEYME